MNSETYSACGVYSQVVFAVINKSVLKHLDMQEILPVFPKCACVLALKD